MTTDSTRTIDGANRRFDIGGVDDVEADTPKTFRVVVPDKVSEDGLQVLMEDSGFEVVQAAGWEKERLYEALAGAHAVIVRSSTTVDREFMERAPLLRVIGRAGVGVDNIDVEAATALGIPVLNAPAGNTVSAAELAFALLLSVVRGIPGADRSVRGGAWERSRFKGIELRGKILGLVGAGRIGGEVARRARAFEMTIIAHDPYLSDEQAEELGVERATLDEILDRADVISLHTPLTSTTRGMIDEDELRRMKSTAFLVNAARGGVVVEAALARALEEGWIAGAALDVYANEPLEEGSPLRGVENAVLTPHLGASTVEAQELVASEICGAIKAALAEGDLSRALNAPAIGGETLRRLRPLLRLAEGVGRLACALSRGGIKSVEVRYAGHEEEAIGSVSAALLTGLLTEILGHDQVNFVNARHLAEARGIKVASTTVSRLADYPEFLEARLESEDGDVRVAGALLGDRHPRIVGIDDFQIDMVPAGTMVVIWNRDVPGVIGKVGGILGSLGLNIAGYHQARLGPGGAALAAVTVDGEVTSAVLEKLRGLEEVTDVRVAELA